MSVKISELPILDSLADNDVIAGVDTSANVTSKIEMATLKNYIDTNTQYTAGTNIDITNNVVSAPNVYNKTETNNLLNAKENISNKVTTLSSSSTNTQYPSAKVVYDELNNLETDLTNDINDLNDEVDNQIQELEEELKSVSTIYNAFPTESGEGESLTLDDTAEVKFKKFDLKGNTSQTTYSGKNLLHQDQYITTRTTNGITYTNNGDGTFSITGTATANTSINILFGASQTGIESGKTYALYSSQPYNSQTFNLSIPFKQDGVQKYLVPGASITTSGELTGISLAFYTNSGNTINAQNVKVMLVEGSTPGDYEPYVGGTASPNPSYPQPVNVVSGDNEINVVGKNLVNYDNNTNLENKVLNASGVFENSSYTYANGTIRPNGNQITISFNSRIGDAYIRIGEYKIDGTFIKRTLVTTTPTILTLDSNTSYLIYSIDKRSDTYFEKMQLEIGSSASSYLPYSGNTYNIDLPVENLLPDTSTTQTINGVTFTRNDNGTITINGTASYNADYYIYGQSTDTGSYLSFKKGKYSILTSQYKNGILFIAREKTAGAKVESSTVSQVTTLMNTQDCYFYGLLIRVEQGTSCNNIIIEPQLEKGSKANSYTPYGTTPIELCKIGNYQDYFGKSDGRNLFDKDNAITSHYYSNSNGGFNTDINATTLVVPIVSGETYTISSTNRSIVDNYSSITFTSDLVTSTTTPYLSRIAWSNNTSSVTFTTPNNAKYIYVYIKWSMDSTAIANTMATIQLEKGSSASDYQPYGVDKWYLHKEIGKLIIDENTDLQTASSDSFRVPQNISIYMVRPVNQNTKVAVFSNYLIPITWAEAWAGKTGFISMGTTNDMRFRITENMTLEEAKTWLTTHNIELYYELVTPTAEEITYQPLIDQLNLLEKAMSKDSQTNISQISNDKPFIISATAIASLQNVLDRLDLLES